MMAGSSSSKLGLDSYIIPIAKVVSMEIRALIRYRKFISSEVALFLYKYVIQALHRMLLSYLLFHG